ncbi:hypothetical protein [Myroides pelagicus]|uniref:Uncharacterized protein n=1 Tax=Myroides pelagicus TaxID=270914 RepID=A0A7K1GM91_9FLAO|nr:hypothetical protein [Myroides pelagicus]MTH29928.1 hypothetical protein [Myroides pelagicus]
MAISIHTFYILLGILALTGLVLSQRYRFSKRILKSNWVFLDFALIIGLLYLFPPRLLTVYSCTAYKEEVILFPVSLGKYKAAFGQHTYIVNKSSHTLTFEHVYYGTNHAKQGEHSIFIKPKEIKEIKTFHIDFLLSTPALSISNNAKGATKTMLTCE